MPYSALPHPEPVEGRTTGLRNAENGYRGNAMDFDFSDEQRLLDETVRRLVKDEYDIQKRKAYMAEPEGFSRKLWARYAEIGLLGLPFAESEGGFGGSAVETMIVMESFGRGLVLEPYLATVVLGGGLVDLAGSAAQKKAILPKLAEGKL